MIKKLSNNLEGWIKNGGPEDGSLNLSSSRDPKTGKPYTYFDYDSSLVALLDLPLNVSCVKPGDEGYPVDVDDAAKICRSSVDSAGVHMICDRGLFLGLTRDQQIEQNHHEFAINVPGLEPDTGPISTYKISLQLAASIAFVSERLLVVNKKAYGNVIPKSQ